MKLPTELKVGHQVYKILPKDQQWFQDTAKFGQCDFYNAEIAIATEGLNGSHVANTLIHEILHGIWREYNLPQDTEEHVVTCVANGLSQVAKDNAGFLKALQKLLDR